MRYIWQGNLRLRNLSFALTAPTQLTKHLKVDVDQGRSVNFEEYFRVGSVCNVVREESSIPFASYNFFCSPKMENGPVTEFLREEGEWAEQHCSFEKNSPMSGSPKPDDTGYFSAPGHSENADSAIIREHPGGGEDRD